MKGIKMTINEALVLLEDAPSDDKTSAVNPSLTREQTVNIVLRGITDGVQPENFDTVLSDLMEKRVHQVVKDQRRPRY